MEEKVIGKCFTQEYYVMFYEETRDAKLVTVSTKEYTLDYVVDIANDNRNNVYDTNLLENRDGFYM